MNDCYEVDDRPTYEELSIKVRTLRDALAARDAEVGRARTAVTVYAEEVERLTEAAAVAEQYAGIAHEQRDEARAERDARTKIAYDVIAERDEALAEIERLRAGRELEQNALHNALPIVAREAALREAVRDVPTTPGDLTWLNLSRRQQIVYRSGWEAAGRAYRDAAVAALAAAPSETEPGR